MDMNEKLIKTFNECWNECDLSEKIAIHNTYVIENNCGDNEIHENDDDFFNTYFEGKPAEAVRASFYGKYRFADAYVWFNAYGNLDSGDFESDMPFNDEDEMGEYFVDNFNEIEHIGAMDDFVSACEYGFDEDEDDED